MTEKKAAFACAQASGQTMERGKSCADGEEQLFTSYLDDFAWEMIRDRLDLSERECEIVCGVLNDRKESTIAADLGISPHTVRTYCERIYRKLGVSNRVRLILQIVETYLSLQSETGCLGSRSAETCSRRDCPLRH